jgi:hypothetical protein
MKIAKEQTRALGAEIEAKLSLRTGLKRSILQTLLRLCRMHGIVYAYADEIAEQAGARERWTREFIAELKGASFLREIDQRHLHYPSILWFPRLISLSDADALAIFTQVWRPDRQSNAGRPPAERHSDRHFDRQLGAARKEEPPEPGKCVGGGGGGGGAATLIDKLFPIVRWQNRSAQDLQLVNRWRSQLAPFCPDPDQEIVSAAVESMRGRPAGFSPSWLRYIEKALQRRLERLRLDLSEPNLPLSLPTSPTLERPHGEQTVAGRGTRRGASASRPTRGHALVAAMAEALGQFHGIQDGKGDDAGREQSHEIDCDYSVEPGADAGPAERDRQ